MHTYKYESNRHWSDSTVSITHNKKSFGIGQTISLSEEEFTELSERYILTLVKVITRPNVVQSNVKSVVNTTDKA